MEPSLPPAIEQQPRPLHESPYELQYFNVDAYTADIAATREAELSQGAIGAEGVQEIIRRGTFNRREIGFEDAGYNALDTMRSRILFAEIASRSPHTAEVLAGRRIGGFHGTNSGAFAGMLQDGSLTAARELFARGRVVVNGEHYANPKGQPTVSFAGFAGMDAALNFSGIMARPRTLPEVISKVRDDMSALNGMVRPGSATRFNGMLRRMVVQNQRMLTKLIREPKSLEAQLMQENFPVLLGIDREFVRANVPPEKGRIWKGERSMSEFRPDPKVIPLENLPVIAVPQEKVARVTGLLKQYGFGNNEVIALEDLVPNEYLDRCYADDQATVDHTRHAQQRSRELGEQRAQRKFVRTRAVARRMIDAVRRKTYQRRERDDEPNMETWSEIDGAWMAAEGANKQVLELAMVAKARHEQHGQYSGTSGTDKIWGARLVNTSARMQVEGAQIGVEIPALVLGEHNTWNVRSMDAYATRSADGQFGSTIRMQCHRVGSNGMGESIVYELSYGPDGQLAKAIATRGGMSREFTLESSNIAELLHSVTTGLSSAEQAAQDNNRDSTGRPVAA